MQIFKNVHNLYTKFRTPNPNRPLIITQQNLLGQMRLFAREDFIELCLHKSFKTSINYRCSVGIVRVRTKATEFSFNFS